jgi:hypothetical protein
LLYIIKSWKDLWGMAYKYNLLKGQMVFMGDLEGIANKYNVIKGQIVLVGERVKIK